MLKKVFVSFDYEDDRNFKYLLNAWNKNKNMEFSFEDCSADEIHTDDISRIKAGLTRRINKSQYTLVIIGANACKKHKDAKEIGYNNWICFEIAKSIENGNKLVAVKLDRSYPSPKEVLSSGAKWALSFTEDAVMNALGDEN